MIISDHSFVPKTIKNIAAIVDRWVDLDENEEFITAGDLYNDLVHLEGFCSDLLFLQQRMQDKPSEDFLRFNQMQLGCQHLIEEFFELLGANPNLKNNLIAADSNKENHCNDGSLAGKLDRIWSDAFSTMSVFYVDHNPDGLSEMESFEPDAYVLSELNIPREFAGESAFVDHLPRELNKYQISNPSLMLPKSAKSISSPEAQHQESSVTLVNACSVRVDFLNSINQMFDDMKEHLQKNHTQSPVGLLYSLNELEWRFAVLLECNAVVENYSPENALSEDFTKQLQAFYSYVLPKLIEECAYTVEWIQGNSEEIPKSIAHFGKEAYEIRNYYGNKALFEITAFEMVQWAAVFAETTSSQLGILVRGWESARRSLERDQQL
jgi:hypothetical protein